MYIYIYVYIYIYIYIYNMGLLLQVLLLQATVGQQVCKEFDGVTTLQMVCDKVKDGDNITS